MSKQSIGSAAFILSANADGMARELDKAAAKAKAWRVKVDGVMGKAAGPSAGGGFASSLTGPLTTGGGGGGMFATAGKALGTAIAGPIGGAIATAVVLAVKESVEAAVKVGSAALGTLNDMAKQSGFARAMGLSAEQFTGIAGLAKSVGEDTREFVESMSTLNKIADEGAAGKGEVAADFFQKLNINAKEFAALRADEQFFRFFEAVRNVDGDLNRVRLTMAAFGEDGGKYLMPLLSKSPDELRKMAAGFAVSAEEMDRATTASAAWSAAGSSIGKAWRAVSVGMADVFTGIAGAVQRVTPMLKAVGEFLAPLWYQAGAAVADFAEMLQPTFDVVTHGLGTMLRVGEPVFNGLAKGLRVVLGIAGSVFNPLLRMIATGFRVVNAMWDAGLPGWAKLWDRVAGSMKPVGEFFKVWAGRIADVWEGLPTIEEMVIKAFRGIGMAGANAFDTLKIAAGGVAEVVGAIIQGFSTLLTSFQTVSNMVNKLPKAIRPEWAAGLAEAVADVGETMKNAGRDLRLWGEKTTIDYGKTADAFAERFDKLFPDGKLPPLGGGAGDARPTEATPPEPLKFASPNLMRSAEAYKSQIQFQYGGLFDSKDKADAIKNEVRDNGRSLRSIDRQLAQGIPIKFDVVEV